MIRRVKIRYFKGIHENEFVLEDSVILAGPNNAGKSTLLQAIVTWKLGLDKWITHRGSESKSKASKRSGVSISRNELSPVPLREMNLLWENRQVTGGVPRKPRFIEIIVEGKSNGSSWTCSLEFQYANPELVYVRPLNAKNLSREEFLSFPPSAAAEIGIVHIPSLSGINRDEPKLDLGMQNQLIGQGRPGEIIRNLLLETSEKNPSGWDSLTAHLHELLGIELIKPFYTTLQPYIVCEYRGPEKGRLLDLSNAGTGSLQIILMLAFLYARPATVLLLDEPDAHLHHILQKQVYELIRKVAYEREGQSIIATHSEVILDATEPTRVISFATDKSRLLSSKFDRDRLRESMKNITTTEVLLGKEIGAMLYVEGETDESILSAWSNILNHQAKNFFARPFVHCLRGRNIRDAKKHFFAIKAIIPEFRSLCLLDGDNLEETQIEETDEGMTILRWNRYEIENYLLQPSAIKRFINFPLLENKVYDEFWKQIPQGTDLFGNHVALVRVKASDEFLIPLFENLKIPITKPELYLLAEKMKPTEIHPEVIKKLDHIAEILC